MDINIIRDFILKGKSMEYDVESGIVKLDDKKYSKDQETNFKGQNEKYYKLEDVWFMLQHRDKQWTNYMKECQNMKFNLISFLDHKELLNYLTGKIDQSAKIDVNHVNAVPLSSERKEKKEEKKEAAASAAAPSKVDAEEKLDEGEVRMMDVDDMQPENNVDHSNEEVETPSKPTPLSEKQQKGLLKKKATIQRDEEEILKIGEKREMKLKEILADAEEVKEITRGERAVVTKDEMLKSNTRNFRYIINLMYLRESEGKHLKRRGTTKRGRESEMNSKKVKDKVDKRHAGKVMVPIIIVPAASTSNVTLLNVEDFLERGQWCSPLKRRESLRGSAPPQRVSFIRPSTNVEDDGSERKVKFEVVDNTRGFTSDHWKRVVAVFTNGKEWEFKGWKLGEPQKMFNRVTGFFVAFRGDPIPPAIHTWNVTILYLDKSSRHMDIIAQKQFWDKLDHDARRRPDMVLK